MEKWTIKPAPTALDSLRHVLLIKGDMNDIAALLRRFGALCGRPKKENTPEGFNYSLPLHRVATVTMESLSSALNEMSGVASGLAIKPLPEGPSAATGTPLSEQPFGEELVVPLPTTPGPEATPLLKPLDTLSPTETKADALPPAGEELVTTPLDQAATPVPTPGPAATPILRPPDTLPPAGEELVTTPLDQAATPVPATPGPAATPTLRPPDTLPPAGAKADTLAPAGPNADTPPPESALPPTPAPDAALVPVVPSATELVGLATPPPTHAEPVGPALSLVVRQPFDKHQNFETMMVGPHNRFAHAASTSVISSPGSMYNPLFLHGGPGVGKTHLMNSIAKGLADSLGEDAVILTSGSRLSFAVSQALANNTFTQMKAEFSKARALVVDDVHLVAVTEANRPALAEVFARFFNENLQVVFGSLYSARALGGLEEALKISLAKGWSVDLKAPNSLAQLEIIQNWLDRQGCQLSTDDTRLFHERLGTGYPDVLYWMRRLLALKKVLAAKFQTAKTVDILNVLFDPGTAETDFPTPSELNAGKLFKPPAPTLDAIRLALVLPKGHENMAGWVARSFYRAATKIGLKQTYRHVLLQVYDASQPFGVPFQIGDACHRARAEAALVIGPPNDTSLASKAPEFSHAVIHVLAGLGISCGWVAHRGGMSPAPFLRAHLDFLASRP